MEFLIDWPQSNDDFTSEESPVVPNQVTGSAERPRRTTTPPPIPRSARPRTLSPTQHIGEWQIVGVLGHGATGSVYAVSHREFGKRAALKLSHRAIETGDLGAKVFAREARVVQRVESPAMPDVFATGMHEGRPYLVMERLKGETLAQLLDRGHMGRKQAIDILVGLCDVLAAAHRSGVVHRDLKLDNVFVLEGTETRIKLLDWGFARMLDEDDPLRGMIAGALNYVAPEQPLGQPITPATDVYSLGVLMYRLLLGERPFAGANDVDLVRRHLYTPPPDPALLWPDIPKMLAQLMTGMLAKEPAARPTLDEVRAVLNSARTGPIGRPPSLRRSMKQRAFGVALAIACVAAGAIAVLAS